MSILCLLSLSALANDTIPEYHILQNQENLYRVSLKYKLPIDSILNWNSKLSTKNFIVGDTVRLSSRKSKTISLEKTNSNDVILIAPKVFDQKKIKSDKLDFVGFPKFIEERKFEGENIFIFEVKEVYTLLTEDANFYLVLFYFAVCFSFSAVLFFLNLLIVRTKRLVKNQKIKRMDKLINDWLARIFFELPYLDDEKERFEIRKEIIANIQAEMKDFYFVEILVKALIKLRGNFSGETAESVRELYFEIGLNNKAIERFNHKDINVRIDSIKEMAQFGVNEIRFEIEKLINHNNERLRIEAQQYLVYFEEYADLRFLQHLKYSLSYWDYMRLHSTLKNRNAVEVTPYDFLLYAKNKSVVLLGILLIRNFKQIQCASSLLTIFGQFSEEEKIQVEIIETLIEIEYIEAKEFFLDLYFECYDEVKIKILEYVGLSGDDTNISFLKKELSKDTNAQRVRLQAGQAMKKVSRSGEFILSQMLKGISSNDQMIIQHALDHRI